MLEFELEIMFIRIGTETNFLDDYLGGVGLHLLRFLLLLIEIFLIVKYLANRRISFGAYLHQIKSKTVSQFESLRGRKYSLFGNILAYKTYPGDSYLLVVLFLVTDDLVRSLPALGH